MLKGLRNIKDYIVWGLSRIVKLVVFIALPFFFEWIGIIMLECFKLSSTTSYVLLVFALLIVNRILMKRSRRYCGVAVGAACGFVLFFTVYLVGEKVLEWIFERKLNEMVILIVTAVLIIPASIPVWRWTMADYEDAGWWTKRLKNR